MWPPPIGKTTKQEKEMNRNCKPGDLAIVVDAYNPANIGTIVRVIRVHPNQGAMCKEPEDLLWFASAPRPMSYDVGGKIILRKKGPVPESLLRPIRGGPLGADIASGINSLPARSIT